MRVDDSHIRKEKVADSKISGYVWTGPKNGAFGSVLLLLIKAKEMKICGSFLIQMS